MGAKEDTEEPFKDGTTYGTTHGTTSKMGQPQKNSDGTS